MPSSGPRTAIYVRVSDDREGSGLGVHRQEEDCRLLADRLGWQVVEVYDDNDISAYSGKSRPKYKRMLADIEAGQIDAIIAWHNDRLHRSPIELEHFITVVERYRIRIQTVRAGELDLSSDHGQLVARQLGAVARYESAHKSTRIRRKHAEIAKAGKPSGGGTRPYGYTKDKLSIVEEEAAVIREVARRLLAGEALAGVAKDLNRRGVVTATGRQWTVQVLKRMAVSARIAGKREHRPRSQHGKRELIGEIVADAVWPAIITPEESLRLRSMLMDPSRRVVHGRNGRYILTGLLYCGRCEGRYRLVGRPTGDGQRRYVCDGAPGRPGCGKLFVLAETLEEYLYDGAAALLDDPAFMEQLKAVDAGTTGPDLLAEIAQDEQELEELARDLGERRMSRREWMAAREPVERRLQVNRAKLARTDHRAALSLVDAPRTGEEARKWLRDVEVPMGRRQAFLAAMIDRVVVHPAVKGRNFLDEGRLEIVWRA